MPIYFSLLKYADLLLPSPGCEHVLHFVQPPLQAPEDLLAGGAALVGRSVQRLASRRHEPLRAV